MRLLHTCSEKVDKHYLKVPYRGSSNHLQKTKNTTSLDFLLFIGDLICNPVDGHLAVPTQIVTDTC